jgi:hypothetical protein
MLGGAGDSRGGIVKRGSGFAPEYTGATGCVLYDVIGGGDPSPLLYGGCGGTVGGLLLEGEDCDGVGSMDILSMSCCNRSRSAAAWPLVEADLLCSI